MPIRVTPLVNEHVYHILNRGVDLIPIFKQAKDYQRFLNLMDYCRFSDYPMKFSNFKTLPEKEKTKIRVNLKDKFVIFVAYCLMPNHFHFVLRQKKNNGITDFINRLLTSYTKFFNTKYERSGPLFNGRFKAVLVESDGQLNHLVRYIHLNPYSSSLIKTKKELFTYPYSSLPEYLSSQNCLQLCEEKEIILSQFTNPEKFKQFILDQADYQKRLESIKHLISE